MTCPVCTHRALYYPGLGPCDAHALVRLSVTTKGDEPMLAITVSGSTESGAAMSGTVVSMGPTGLTADTANGRRTFYRDSAPRLFSRALGGVVTWDVAHDALKVASA